MYLERSNKTLKLRQGKKGIYSSNTMISSNTNSDGVVKSLHILCYSGWSYARHTTCMPSRMANRYALYTKIFT